MRLWPKKKADDQSPAIPTEVFVDVAYDEKRGLEGLRHDVEGLMRKQSLAIRLVLPKSYVVRSSVWWFEDFREMLIRLMGKGHEYGYRQGNGEKEDYIIIIWRRVTNGVAVKASE